MFDSPTHDNLHDSGTAVTNEDLLTGEFLEWLNDRDRITAITQLDQLTDPDAHLMAMALALEMHQHPDIDMTPVQIVTIVVMLLNADAVDLDHTVDPTDTAAIQAIVNNLCASRLRGIYETRQQAAFAAVRQLGSARVFGVADSIEAQLGDTTRAASQRILDLVDRYAQARHGWYIRHDKRVGWVLFRTNDR